MSPAETIARALGGRKSGEGWQVRCPAHDDAKPSLSISDGADGRVLVRCHAGCGQDAVIDALRDRGLWPPGGDAGAKVDRADADRGKLTRMLVAPGDAPKPDFTSLVGSKPATVGEYRSVDGQLMGYVVRIENAAGKTFRPITLWRNASDKLVWCMKGFANPFPLFGQEQLAERRGEPVLVVEGEKAAVAAGNLFPDYVVITWPGGAASAAKSDWKVLAGRSVTLWPDADAPGRKAMVEISSALAAGGAARLSVVALPPNLPKGWDVADPPPEGFDMTGALRAAKDTDPTLARYFLNAEELLALSLPEQEFMVGTFMPTQSLSMVFAERGLGKTWLCMTLSLALAKGEPFLGYDVPKARRVLYIDGEMALSELQARQRALDPVPPDTLEYLPSELLYQQDRPLNLHAELDQKRVLDALARREAQGRSPELIVVDNLSSLAHGMDENSNSDLDNLMSFLLGLRHQGYSVLLVHHAGKNMTQRGASRREDFLNLSIELRRPDKKRDHKYRDGGASGHDGAHFILEFSKVRGRSPRPDKLDLKLCEPEPGRVDWLLDDALHATQEDRVLRFIVEEKPETQRQIAEGFIVSAGRMSQICGELRRRGYLSSGKNKKLTVTAMGGRRLLTIWPELSGIVEWQDDLEI